MCTFHFFHIKGLQFYLSYGYDLREVIFGLHPIKEPLLLQLTICCISTIISGFGFLSILMKLKSHTLMVAPGLFYFLIAVSE